MRTSSQEGAHCEGATLRIHHKIKPGAHERYETWLRQIIEAAGRFPGHQGVHILRPPAQGQDYEIAVRFAGEEDARRWRESNERRELMAAIQPELAQDERLEFLSGIDYWFTPPASDARVPVRWKQWLITTAVIWPLTLLVPLLWWPLFQAVPALQTWGLRHGLVAATVVALVVYVVMPPVARLASPWLHRR
ncbi:antibiotic biosynthesis monooxygenase [Chromohalobacter israelensis]|uniref:Antibiotic biosynthesis monooxygenase n=1 Tax=Chromohalobacter israelensis (strain ATCC BAA-138 / DSM 3043 / CIP 106854 / NCIMB 13768 / 1H11) TaxID=290398 RepID=Q1QWM9_CHRI1|nr:antibiotic biosynthesis monooxygenase [Chromohalobacter salexigens]ABE59129.1 Antibiotic biosynthesis monooxygenase [Chromohalobacter salexigens DSM 3043]